MRPLAPLSLDLDNKWSYLKTHGDASWERLPSYLDVAVPRILETLDDTDLHLTVFVVGRDAAQPKSRELIGAIADAGHEIGNHSFEHEPWLHLYEPTQLSSDFERAEDAITAATNRQPRGFRGPGFSLSNATLEELAARGYDYDASVLPNVLNPVGRTYYFMRSNMSREERRQRKALFGTLKDAFRPNVPFRWQLEQTTMLEVPVTTMPGLRVPFHFSYVIWLAGKSPTLARLYFRTALALCKRTNNPPSLLLHPPDFLGVDDEPDLGFFPGMNLPSGQKLELLAEFLEMLAAQFHLVPMGDYVTAIAPDRVKTPDFADA